MNPYAVTPSEIDLARELTLLLGLPVSVWGGNPEITHWANDKWHTYMMALELGVPAPPAELVILESIDKEKPPDIAPLQRAVAHFSEQTGKAMVRGIRGTSGTTNLVADPVGPKLEEDLQRLVRNRTTNSYMIQPFFNIAASPNIQLFIEPDTGGISCVSVTDQYLDRNLAHHGNLYPSTATTIPHMLRSAHRMAKGLRDKGYTGLAGFDFVEHVDPETGRTVHFLAEINARVNAATYPCSLMERIARRQLSRDGPIPGAFFSSHIRTRARSFREFLDIHGDRIFDSKRGCAMVPFHTGALDYGACSVVVFGGSRNEVMALYREIERVS
ncbi:MAG: hypothetical protein JRK53_27840 [Deltaproteobacteria bacterium]|nr:hypothetical protein [Deltaproteobacteria bacterium]